MAPVSNYTITREYIDKRRRAVVIIFSAVVATNIVWAFGPQAAGVGLWLSFFWLLSGVIGLGNIAYLLYTKNLRVATYILLPIMPVLSLPFFLGFESSDYSMAYLSVSVIIMFLLLEWRAIWWIIGLFSIFLVFVFIPELRPPFASPRVVAVSSSMWDTLVVYWVLLYWLDRIRSVDQDEISKKNSELLKLNSELSQEGERVAEVKRDLEKETSELSKLRKSLEGRARVIEELESEIATYE